MFRKITIFRFSLSILLTACNTTLNQPAGNKLQVVATFSVLGDLVQNVGGNAVEVKTLVGPGMDTHTFEPSPADSKALAEAVLLFENGLGFEPWLGDVYAASGSNAKRVAITAGITPLKAEEAEHGEFDPHVWHSVANTIQMVENIREALIQADRANAAIYQSNAEAYLAQLQTLDNWIFNEVKKLPEARRKLVTTHDTFGYFAERYGFEIVGAVLPATTEGASPSAQEIAALVEKVNAASVPAVFAENVSSNTLLRQIADEAGVAVVAALYTDALGPAGSAGGTYLEMMRFNVTTIVAELGK